MSTQDARCELCAEFGADTEATIRVVIPMAGETPRYWLCDDHAAELDAHVDEIEAGPVSTQDAYEAAREAAVERMLATVHANNEYGQDASQLYDGWGDDDDIRKLFRLVLGSALAVPECPDCGGATRWQCFGCRKRFDGDLMAVCPNCHREGYWTGSVKPCSSCGGSGQSRARVLVGERVGKQSRLTYDVIVTLDPIVAPWDPVFRALAPTPEATK